jgi:hypothetical protein
MNEKPDCLELERLMLRAEKAAGPERAAKLREAAAEARAWMRWHGQRSNETFSYGGDFEEGTF